MPELTLTAARAQLAHTHTQYMESADGMDVQDDLDAREAAANATHTQRTNAQLDPSHVHVTTNPVSGLKSYSGGNVVALPDTAVGDTDDLQYMVRTALDADQLMDKGGDVDSPVTDYTPASDGTWLAEASKQTGEKLF